MREIVNITKALADPNRLRILAALTDEELCVCQIIEMLGLAPSTVSKHMYILRQARLVEARKEGRWIFYRRAGRNAPKPAREAVAWVRRNLMDARQVREDSQKLERILKIDREELCKRQAGN